MRSYVCPSVCEDILPLGNEILLNPYIISFHMVPFRLLNSCGFCLHNFVVKTSDIFIYTVSATLSRTINTTLTIDCNIQY